MIKDSLGVVLKIIKEINYQRNMNKSYTGGGFSGIIGFLVSGCQFSVKHSIQKER